MGMDQVKRGSFDFYVVQVNGGEGAAGLEASVLQSKYIRKSITHHLLRIRLYSYKANPTRYLSAFFICCKRKAVQTTVD